jgi:hypothetical protein
MHCDFIKINYKINNYNFLLKSAIQKKKKKEVKRMSSECECHGKRRKKIKREKENVIYTKGLASTEQSG